MPAFLDNNQENLATIVNNQSGITLDVGKLMSMPIARERPEYREVFADDATMSVRVFDVAWSMRKAWIDAMLGYAQTVDTLDPMTLKVTGSTLSRVTPAQHPEYEWLYATKAELLTGVGTYGKSNKSGMIAWYRVEPVVTDGYARYAVTYEALDYEVFSDTVTTSLGKGEIVRYVSRYETYAVENLQIPGSIFKYMGTTTPIMTNPTKRFPTKEITYLWHEVPEIPEGAINNALGKVNAAVGGKAGTDGYFDGIYPPETLLFLAPNWKRYRTKTGRKAYDIHYKFLYRPSTWNKVYRATAFDFVKVTSDGTAGGTTLYQSVDFASQTAGTGLFVIPAATGDQVIP